MTAGFFGSAAGALTFITVFNEMTQRVYANKRFVDVDFRLKNILIYMVSDFCAGFAKIGFETRKQLIMMYNHDATIEQIAHNCRVGTAPLILRDIYFRSILLGFYYATTHVEHKPQLKYSVT